MKSVRHRKNKYHIISFICEIKKKKVKLIVTESRMVVTRKWRKRELLIKCISFHL